MFDIQKRQVVHSGGTKFYQIITIKGGGYSACIDHYGPWKGTWSMPAGSGQNIVETFTNEFGAKGHADQKQSAKKKRGYDKWEVKTGGNLPSLEDLEQWILRNVGGARGQDLIAHFKKAPNLIAPPTKPEPKQPEPKRREPEPAKPQEWGSW